MHPPEDVLSVFDSPQEILVSRLFFANQLIENQGVVEFHIAGIPGPVGHAELHLPVINTIRPFGLGVFSYAGNGAVDVSDFASGSLVSVYLLGMNPVPPNGTITVDVTNAINSLIAAHASFAGFNLRVMQPPNDEGTIVLNDPTLSITAP